MRKTFAVLAAATAVGALPAAPAHAVTTVCTWAGTPTAETGWFTLSPGITTSPSTAPLAFQAWGPLGGGCRGHFRYTGQFDTGATCAFSSFHARATGLPGVVRAAGYAPGLIPAPALLYDRHGNVVGEETAQIDTPENGAKAIDCLTPGGFTGGSFSSVIVLFG